MDMGPKGYNARGAGENSLLYAPPPPYPVEACANARWANQLIFITSDILPDHPTGNRNRGEWFWVLRRPAFDSTGIRRVRTIIIIIICNARVLFFIFIKKKINRTVNLYIGLYRGCMRLNARYHHYTLYIYIRLVLRK